MKAKPEWFQLEKYDNLIEWDSRDWVMQLLLRKSLFELPVIYHEKLMKPLFDSPTSSNNVDNDAKPILNKSVRDLSMDEFLKFTYQMEEPNMTSSKLIGIDLDAPQKVIIQEFIMWIKSQETISSRKRITVKKLINNKVLQYIDLILWFKLNQIPLPTQLEIGRWLFQDQTIDVQNKIKKFTKILADSCIQGNGIKQVSYL